MMSNTSFTCYSMLSLLLLVLWSAGSLLFVHSSRLPQAVNIRTSACPLHLCPPILCPPLTYRLLLYPHLCLPSTTVLSSVSCTPSCLSYHIPFFDLLLWHFPMEKSGEEAYWEDTAEGEMGKLSNEDSGDSSLDSSISNSVCKLKLHWTQTRR